MARTQDPQEPIQVTPTPQQQATPPGTRVPQRRLRLELLEERIACGRKPGIGMGDGYW